MRAGSNWRHLNGLSLGMMGDPVRCLPKVVHPDVAALKLQHNRSRRLGTPAPLAPAGADRLGRSGGRTVVPAAAPRPVTSRADTLLEEPFYEEQLRPVCSQALLAARGRPRQLAAALRPGMGR